MKIPVLYEDNHILAVEKPVNVPVMADASGDADLLNLCKAYLKEKYHKPGNVYLGLVHRLDRPVGGVMVFARTSKAASRLSEAIRSHRFIKTYLAVTDGIPEPRSGHLEDYLRKNARTNMVTVSDPENGRYCSLFYQVLQIRGRHALVQIQLETGRSHQIRVQMASRGWPLVCDQRYNPRAGKGQIALWSSQIVFPHPVQQKPITVRSLPPQVYPWTEFEVKEDEH